MSRVLSWDFGGAVRLWDVKSGDQIGAALLHQESMRGAQFNGDETKILSWSNDKTIRLWDVGADHDVSKELALLEVQALVGAGFNLDNDRFQVLRPAQWRQLKGEYEALARAHYKTCQYPEHNVWRRYHLEEAETLRPLN